MKQTAAFVLVGLLLAAALASGEYLRLENETLYCERYDISVWCNDKGVEFLQSLPPEVLTDYVYINEFAFGDQVRYTGPLRIREITVTADLTISSQVEAVYEIDNTGDSPVTTHIIALGTPENSQAYDNSELMDVDPLLDGWDATFEPGETREIRITLTEPLYGQIFGYNVNLLFDSKTTDNHVTPLGTFTFKLPPGTTLKQCVPTGYTTTTEGGRTVVTWSKRDFIPWTNPFNDLVCTWTTGAAPQQEQPAAQGGDNTMVWIILIMLILGGVFWLYRSGRLEDLLNR